MLGSNSPLGKAAPLSFAVLVAGVLLAATPADALAGLKVVGQDDPTGVTEVEAVAQPDMVERAESPTSDAASPVTDAKPVLASQLAEGVYDIEVSSSSSMFRVVGARLTVADGHMSCVLTLSGTGYGKLFMGTAEQAARADEPDCVPFVEDESGAYTYEVPVEALDAPTDCAAWSIRKQTWYDRTLVFSSAGVTHAEETDGGVAPDVTPDATSADAQVLGQAAVSLSGGSGKASVASPADVIAADDGTELVRIVWSSTSYDLMLVDGVEYAPVTLDGGSTFEIPLPARACEMAVSARTLAMSQPHVIDYTLTVSAVDQAGTQPAPGAATDTAGGAPQEAGSALAARDTTLGLGWAPIDTLDLSYATQFAVDYYEGGYRLITLASGERYLMVPQDAAIPDGLPDDVATLQEPLDNIYLVTSSMPCLFDALGASTAVSVLGVNPDECAVASFTEALASGQMVYGGKYSAPDYELLVASGTRLAIESTMIEHSPQVRDQLRSLGIPVLTELSGHEPSPLGRMEWIKLVGALVGERDEAARLFDGQVALVDAVLADIETAGEGDAPTVAFFYVNANGSAVVRRSDDYIVQAIELAGGDYVFADAEQLAGTGAVTLEMEQFYALARDADVIVYNATIDGGVSSLLDLVEKNPLLADFAAVQAGRVWVTDADMYQQMTQTGAIIADLHAAFAADAVDDLTFLHRLG